MKNKNGVTLSMLIVTVILFIIVTSIATVLILTNMNSSKIQIYKTNMAKIQLSLGTFFDRVDLDNITPPSGSGTMDTEDKRMRYYQVIFDRYKADRKIPQNLSAEMTLAEKREITNNQQMLNHKWIKLHPVIIEKELGISENGTLKEEAKIDEKHEYFVDLTDLKVVLRVDGSLKIDGTSLYIEGAPTPKMSIK